MKGYENDKIVNNLQRQIQEIEIAILSNHDRIELSNPKRFVEIKRSIIEAQQPLYDALAKYISTHPAPIVINVGDEMDDVSEESKEKVKEILNNNKKYFKQILKFKSTPKKTDFFDAAMLTPNYNQIIKNILDKK
jgi:D-alanine-D-alanine ligase-like ATP-grasp enzyme